jgi:hypothetical protein
VLFTILTAVALVPTGQPFACTPTRVWDGDGPIWCAEGPHVRVAGIAAREIGGMCRRYQPCPKATATGSRDALVRLVGRSVGKSREGHVLVRGPAMRCVSVGDAKVTGRPPGASRRSEAICRARWCGGAARYDGGRSGADISVAVGALLSPCCWLATLGSRRPFWFRKKS